MPGHRHWHGSLRHASSGIRCASSESENLFWPGYNAQLLVALCTSNNGICTASCHVSFTAYAAAEPARCYGASGSRSTQGSV
eukprot:399810-Rhodomonas_salina.4